MDNLDRQYRDTAPNLIDITSLAHISASSSQPSHPPEHLIDNSAHSFWQSNGGQPHTLTIRFSKRVELCEIWFFLNFALDESYTPQKIQMFVGTGAHDMHPCLHFELNEPQGWEKFDLQGVNCHFVMLRIEENHLGGKDTLIRGLRIYSSRPKRSIVDF